MPRQLLRLGPDPLRPRPGVHYPVTSRFYRGVSVRFHAPGPMRRACDWTTGGLFSYAAPTCVDCVAYQRAIWTRWPPPPGQRRKTPSSAR